MSDMTIVPIDRGHAIPQMSFCPSMADLSGIRHVFCNMCVVVSPFIERQLEPCLEESEEEEMDRRHKVKKVNRRSRAGFTFMKQRF